MRTTNDPDPLAYETRVLQLAFERATVQLARTDLPIRQVTSIGVEARGWWAHYYDTNGVLQNISIPFKSKEKEESV